MTALQFAQFALAVGVFALGLIIGMVIEALRDRVDSSDPVASVTSGHDATLLSFLERAECNLLFNPALNAWAMLDGEDKMVSTAHSVRATLARAMVREPGGA